MSDSDGRLEETHHDLEGLRITEVSGTIVDLELLRPDGSRVLITRLPSGRALRGFDDRDDGDLVGMYTNELTEAIDREVADPEFIVTLEVDR